MTDQQLKDHWDQLANAFDAASTIVEGPEMDAAAHAYTCILEVLAHGARDRGHHNGEFIRQGYNVQIEHLEDHLRARGKIDPDSGLPNLRLALTRAALAVALEDGIFDGKS